VIFTLSVSMPPNYFDSMRQSRCSAFFSWLVYGVAIPMNQNLDAEACGPCPRTKPLDRSPLRAAVQLIHVERALVSG
jgi:hypothetical protein